MITNLVITQSTLTCDHCATSETVVYGDGDSRALPGTWILAYPNVMVMTVGNRRATAFGGWASDKVFCRVDCLIATMDVEIRAALA